MTHKTVTAATADDVGSSDEVIEDNVEDREALRAADHHRVVRIADIDVPDPAIDDITFVGDGGRPLVLPVPHLPLLAELEAQVLNAPVSSAFDPEEALRCTRVPGTVAAIIIRRVSVADLLNVDLIQILWKVQDGAKHVRAAEDEVVPARNDLLQDGVASVRDEHRMKIRARRDRIDESLRVVDPVIRHRAEAGHIHPHRPVGDGHRAAEVTHVREIIQAAAPRSPERARLAPEIGMHRRGRRIGLTACLFGDHGEDGCQQQEREIQSLHAVQAP